MAAVHLVILGRQGSGKGTQAARLVEAYSPVHVSTGDMLRAAVAAGTELGRRAGALMDAGDLVGDDLINGIVAERLAQPDVAEHGFLLDGYPRTPDQAAAMEGFLAEAGTTLDVAVNLDVPVDEVTARMLARGRADDTEEAIRRRLDLYEAETAPLLAWFADRGLLEVVDGMGDDIPPGEINHQTADNQHFGHPWYGGGDVRTNEYKGEEIPADIEVVMPAVETIAHAADLGISFYNGSQFPEEYHNAIFSAQHGSWNRTTPVGARVMVTMIDDEGNATTKPFAEGWIDENGEYLGRPVDVANLRDGSILVSDDLAGAVYRISYGE